MTVGELRALLLELGTADIPDDAPVLIQSEFNILGTYAEIMPLPRVIQASEVGETPGKKALVFFNHRG